MPYNYSGPVPLQYAQVGSGAGNTTDLTLAFPSSVTAGNLLIAALSWYSADTPASWTVTDSLGQTFAQVFTKPAGVTIGGCALYYFPNTSGGANSVTFHSSTSLYKRLAIAELPGISTTTLDTSVTANGSSTAPNSGTITPSAAGNLLVGVEMYGSSSVNHWPNPAWQTLITGTGTSDIPLILAIQTAISTSAIAATFTTASSVGWAAGIASFKNMGPAASGAVIVVEDD